MRRHDPKLKLERKWKLLRAVIEEFIKTSRPVGSLLLTQEGGLKLSASSICGQMAELEAEGYLSHPHTSSGCIPTDKGYRFYLETLAVERWGAANAALEPNTVERYWEIEALMTSAAKTLASSSGLAGFIFSPPLERQGFHLPRPQFHLGGLTNILAHSDLRATEQLLALVNLFDDPAHLGSLIASEIQDSNERGAFNRIRGSTVVKVGSENRIKDFADYSLVFHAYGQPEAYLGVWGPKRMDYPKVIALVQGMAQVLDQVLTGRQQSAWLAQIPTLPAREIRYLDGGQTYEGKTEK